MASDWLRSRWLDLLLSLLIAAAEAAAVAPWLPLAAHAAGAGTPSPVGLFLVGLISFWSARWFLASGWDIASVRALSLAVWLGMMVVWYGLAGAGWLAPYRLFSHLLTLDPTLVLLLIIGGVAWWRGISLATEPDPFNPDYARGIVWRGALVIGAAVVLGSLASHGAARQANDFAAIALPVFLFASLAAAGAAQARAARREVRSGGDPVRLGLGSSAGLAAVMLLLGIAVAGLAERDFWASLFAHLGFIGSALSTVAYWVVAAFAWLVFLLLYPFIWLFQHFAHPPPPQQPQQQNQGPSLLDQVKNQAHGSLPAWERQLIEVLIVAAVVALLVWLVLRSLRRLRRTAEEAAVDEFHESVWSADLALAQLRDLFSGLRPRRAAHAGSQGLDLSGEPADVREAYRRLVVLGAREGEARLPGETAIDYSRRLERAWAGLDAPLDDLTARYLRARYAEQSDAEDIHHARLDWRAIVGRFTGEGKR